MRNHLAPLCFAALASAVHLAAAQADPLSGAPIDEAYRAKFSDCDHSDRFGGVQFPIRKPNGKVAWYGCKTDPSRFRRFERIPKKTTAPEAILVEAKLAHDRDGSPAACNDPGATDQCPTSLMLKPTSARPCPQQLVSRGTWCLPVNADEIPYIVMPGFGPPGIESAAFARLTSVKLGDLGVVIANGKVVPVLVADVGPAYKIGEGSTALLKALSADGKPRTIASGVRFVIFPGTALGRDFSADLLAAEVEKRGAELYRKVTGN